MWIERERYKGNIRELIEATQLAVLIVVDGTKNTSDPARPWWLKLSQYRLYALAALTKGTAYCVKSTARRKRNDQSDGPRTNRLVSSNAVDSE
jgi:hypothetical protein